MKASELRVGNKVDLYGSVATVTRYDFNELPPKGLAVDCGKPIPLTEELVIKKCGFESVIHRSGIAAAYLLNGIRIHMSNSGNWYYKKRSLYGLHDLQNLYFALKDKELKIKL